MGAINPLARRPPRELSTCRFFGERLTCVDQCLSVYAVVNCFVGRHGSLLRVCMGKNLKEKKDRHFKRYFQG
jgi:hypothetical protein